MIKNSFQYFIGIGLPPKENEFFAVLKKRFHANGNLESPAHVTIIPPFFCENEVELFDRLQEWAKKRTIFEVEFKEVGSFRQSKYGTVFFAPNKTEHFKDIYNTIHNDISRLPKKRGGEFIPHLTVANRAPLEKMEGIKNQLQEMKISLELKVNCVVVYRRRINQNWSFYKKVEFNGRLE